MFTTNRVNLSQIVFILFKFLHAKLSCNCDSIDYPEPVSANNGQNNADVGTSLNNLANIFNGIPGLFQTLGRQTLGSIGGNPDPISWNENNGCNMRLKNCDQRQCNSVTFRCGTNSFCPNNQICCYTSCCVRTCVNYNRG